MSLIGILIHALVLKNKLNLNFSDVYSVIHTINAVCKLTTGKANVDDF